MYFLPYIAYLNIILTNLNMICPEEVPILDETTIEQHLKLKSFVDLEQIKLSILK